MKSMSGVLCGVGPIVLAALRGLANGPAWTLGKNCATTRNCPLVGD